MESRFDGIFAAPVTALHPGGSVNLDAIAHQAQALIRSGVDGVFVCGSTGEGVSFSTEERQAIARRWVEAAGDALRVIVHVGHASVPDAVALAEDAQSVGVAAISAMGPFYFKPSGVESLLDFLEPIAAAAPQTPFFYYHTPGMTGVALPMRPLLEQAPSRLPNFAGLKFSHGDLSEFVDCLRFDNGRYPVLWGTDEWTLAARAVGMRGAIGSSYNYATPLYKKLWAAFDEGDIAEARRLSETAMEMQRRVLARGGIAGTRAVLERQGVPVGPPRPPLRPLPPEQGDALYAGLVAIGAVQ